MFRIFMTTFVIGILFRSKIDRKRSSGWKEWYSDFYCPGFYL